MTHTPAPRLDHGAIGNGRVLALVAPTSHIDWLCMPRFDSPSVFARLLDTDCGGSFAILPVCDSPDIRMDYVANTNVLRTEMRCEDGRFDIFDFAPRIPSGITADAPLEIHRLLVPREGSPRVRVLFDPQPDYARHRPQLVPVENGFDVTDGHHGLHLRTNVPVAYLDNRQAVRVDEPKYFVLSYGKPPQVDSAAAVQKALDDTIAGWRAWVKTCALPSFADAHVLRSALCLKLHAFVDTGAIIAAATTSIPEALGTERTWDYRYCWLRDAAFVVEALRRLGHLAEGEAFVSFLRDVAEAGPLQPLYGIGGERELPEQHLDHLAGFGGSRPVRIGNAAYQQRQHDLMGEVILCLDTITADPRVVLEDHDAIHRLVVRLVNKAIRLSDSDDTGLWEFRTLPARYTFSQALCWVAASRGARVVRRFGDHAQADQWDAWSGPFKDNLLARAYNAELGYFTQTLNGQHPDAANLLLPTLGVVEPDDPRFVATVDAYERLLVEKGLMLRYKHPDDFGETTSAFTICSFWWAEALALMGKLDEAMAVFHRIVEHANGVGLFSEDIEPGTGRLLGNFPQAYTHVGLVHAAVTIGELLDARDRRFRAWT
jgi:GH15 family glucan-1,4-alpha-glucosidase